MPQMPASFSAGNGGPTQQATYNGEPAAIFDQAVRAIIAAGGQIAWQQAPSTAKFVLGKKDMWTTGGFTMKYDGDLQIQKTAPSQSTARLTLRINWGSYVPLGATTLVILLILAASNPMYAGMGLLFMGAILVYSAWAVSSQLPEKVLKDIVQKMQAGAGPVAPVQATPAPARPAPPAAPPTPPPAAAAPPPVAPAPAAPSNADTATIVEQIKQLAGLRDAGAITVEEFEAKKTELLKRI
jgi:hypothetical protein